MSSQQVSSQPFQWRRYAEFDGGDFQIRGQTLFFILVLFSVILVLALLFIDAWWFRLVSHPLPSPEASTYAAEHLPPPPYRGGLDLTTINNMAVVLNKNSGDYNSEAECCICLGIFGEQEKVKVLPDCRHCFHLECVDKWLMAQSSCPLCRATLRVDSPV